MIASFRKIDGVPLNIERSKVESDRHGLSIGRLNVPLLFSIRDDEIVSICKGNKYDVVIVRYPTSRIKLANLLARCDDFVSFQADTLVYFSLKADSRPISILPSTDYRIRPAVSTDRDDMSGLAGASFTNYTSHYSANPIFNEKKILDGYVEWAVSYLGQASFESLIALTSDDALMGFITMKIDYNLAEILLNGVHPTYQGQGVYTGLLNKVLEVGKLHGVDEVVISSQVSNIRVIRSWIKMGFTLDCSLNTIHLMRR